jgi:CubicO group peptidase (beta-lactamase class C family)
MMPRVLRVSLIALALCAPAPRAAHPQSGAPAEAVADRMRHVEEGLLRPTTIRGRSAGMRLDQRMRDLAVPGVSIAVIHDGRIEWAKGYGATSAGGPPVDTATLFQAASISKPVAAMAALRLVQDGLLSLDEDVNPRLRSWKIEENEFTRASAVTLRRLLSHNAGLTVHGFRGYAAGEEVPGIVQVLQGAGPANSAPVRADVAPGSIWRYSGGGSSVVQLLIEDVTGRQFADVVRELVLEPAGMVHSGFEQPLPAGRAARAATGHRAGGQPVPGSWHTYPEMFAAGLWTTPSDLARLALEVQGSLAGRSNRILSTTLTREMLTRQAGDYGLGFGLQIGNGWTGFSHGGANEGFRAMFFAMAENGSGAIVMTNGDNGAILAGEIMRAIARVYDWPTYRTIERDVVQLPDAVLESFAGDYTFARDGATLTLSLAVDGATLRSTGPPLGVRTLHPGGNDVFFLLENLAVLRFERGTGGQVTGVVIEGIGSPLRLTRA